MNYLILPIIVILLLVSSCKKESTYQCTLTRKEFYEGVPQSTIVTPITFKGTKKEKDQFITDNTTIAQKGHIDITVQAECY